MSSTGKDGFTLVEVIVVIVVITVLATMIVPRMSASTGPAALRESARRLLVTVRYARDFAVTYRRGCRLMFDPNEHQYGLAYQEDPEHRPGRFSPLRTAMGKAAPLGRGLRFAKLQIDRPPDADAEEAETPYVDFAPSGRANAAIVEITDGRGSYSILIAPNTPQAKLVEGTVDELPNDRIDLDE